MNQSNAVQIYQPSYNLPILADRDEMMELMQDMEGVTPEFQRVKFPAGGALAFDLKDESGEDVAISDLQGVIIDRHAVNVYYKSAFTGGNEAPDCTAADGKIGRAAEGAPVPWAGGCQECATCPFNQFGPNNEPKPCKNQERLYLLREGDIFPVIITVPPTSRKPLNSYLSGLMNKLKPAHAVVTSIKLKKEVSNGGIKYSSGVFTKVKDLTKDEAKAIKAYGEQLRPILRREPEQVVTVVEEGYGASAPPPSDEMAPPEAEDQLF
ncbi:hypothetical protein M3223_04260 [Paenibacillus pasadenensis]|uniref:hypothetical protein n=1 Tax=Paenibacillus pasadenensis TaxID=217090 RepID=UPI00203F063D|nr:hypothetical protein [Paenibacillus pasadenensis]MCM3746563.1 hypothetical protein [Paenibacillus pasadenensis]